MKFFNVADEFEKNSELKEEDLTHLREWLSKQPHLPLVTGKYFLCYFRISTRCSYTIYHTLHSVPSHVKLLYL